MLTGVKGACPWLGAGEDPRVPPVLSVTVQAGWAGVDPTLRAPWNQFCGCLWTLLGRGTLSVESMGCAGYMGPVDGAASAGICVQEGSSQWGAPSEGGAALGSALIQLQGKKILTEGG